MTDLVSLVVGLYVGGFFWGTVRDLVNDAYSNRAAVMVNMVWPATLVGGAVATLVAADWEGL